MGSFALTMSGVALPPGAVFLGNPNRDAFTWVRVIYGHVKDGVLVRVGISTDGRGVLDYLKKRYGSPKSNESKQMVEWERPGLHISYSPPILNDVPVISSNRAPTHKCIPGSDCDGVDEMKADFWSALPGAVGGLAAVNLASRPNLVFEVASP